MNKYEVSKTIIALYVAGQIATGVTCADDKNLALPVCVNDVSEVNATRFSCESSSLTAAQ